MPTALNVGTKVEDIDLVGLFSPGDGVITQYYGRIGNGKTYNATADVLDLLSAGQVVYANWKLKYDGFDQRKSLFYIIRGLLFPWSVRYYSFRPENLRYISIDDHFLDNFERITDAHVFLDEGHVVFDSYEMAKMSLKKRAAVLHTRHFDRSIHIISQRPTAVHVSMRANVNIFYKCEKVMQWPLLIFKRTEFQDLASGETVDETQPVSVKHYLADKKVLNAYDTKYLRGDMPPSQSVHFDAYDLSYSDKFKTLLALILQAIPLKRNSLVEPEARNFLEDQSPPAVASPLGETGLDQNSLGVKPELASIKSGERLNTVPTGRNYYADVRRQRMKNFKALRKAKEESLVPVMNDQDSLPF